MYLRKPLVRLICLFNLLATTACAPPERMFRGAPPDTQRFELSGFELSHDGQLLAFDFTKYTADGGIYPTSVAVLDLATGALRTYDFHDGTGYHSPAFSPDGKQLAMIQFCWWEGCAPQDLGHQIVLADLADGSIRRVTDDARLATVVERLCCDERLVEAPLVRGLPAFAPDGSWLLHSGAERLNAPGGRYPEPYRQDEQFQLFRLDLASGEQELLLRPDGFFAFRWLDNLAVLPDGSIFATGHDILDRTNPSNLARQVEADRWAAFRYDPVTGALEPLLIDEQLAGPVPFAGTFAGPAVSTTREAYITFIRHVDVSSDGRSLAFSAHVAVQASVPTEERESVVYLQRDGLLQALYWEPGVFPYGVTIAGDGSRIAFGHGDGAPAAVTLLDLISGKVKSYPLHDRMEALWRGRGPERATLPQEN